MKAFILALFLSSCAVVPSFSSEYYSFDRTLDPTAGANITIVKVKPTSIITSLPKAKPKTSKVPKRSFKETYVYNIVMQGQGVIGTTHNLTACRTFVSMAINNFGGKIGFFCAPELRSK